MNIETYCVECDLECTADIVTRRETIAIKGESVEYDANVAVCPVCGAEIGDSRVESGNLAAAYDEYRERHSIVSPGRIKQIRSAMGLSVREFSRFLGFGEQTAAKYERGSIPDVLHSNTVKMAATATGASMLLEMNREYISEDTARKVSSYIEALVSSGGGTTAHEATCLATAKPSKMNGYRPFDAERTAYVVYALAEKCSALFKTKLQKAMFFCDSLSFERTGTSMTGITYAHADFGPVMNDYALLIARLKSDGVISLEPSGWGSVVVPASEPPHTLGGDELEIIDEVALFVDSFNSSGELSDYSHGLAAWKTTRSGELIAYGKSHGEVSAAVQARMDGNRKA